VNSIALIFPLAGSARSSSNYIIICSLIADCASRRNIGANVADGHELYTSVLQVLAEPSVGLHLYTTLDDTLVPRWPKVVWMTSTLSYSNVGPASFAIGNFLTH